MNTRAKDPPKTRKHTTNNKAQYVFRAQFHPLHGFGGHRHDAQAHPWVFSSHKRVPVVLQHSDDTRSHHCTCHLATHSHTAIRHTHLLGTVTDFVFPQVHDAVLRDVGLVHLCNQSGPVKEPDTHSPTPQPTPQ